MSTNADCICDVLVFYGFENRLLGTFVQFIPEVFNFIVFFLLIGILFQKRRARVGCVVNISTQLFLCSDLFVFAWMSSLLSVSN